MEPENDGFSKKEIPCLVFWGVEKNVPRTIFSVREAGMGSTYQTWLWKMESPGITLAGYQESEVVTVSHDLLMLLSILI